MREATISNDMQPGLLHPYRVDVEGGPAGAVGCSEECTTAQEAYDWAVEQGAQVIYCEIYGTD